MKIVDLTCPKCGATLQVDAEREEAVCKHCDYRMLIEKEDTAEEIFEKEQAKSYGYHKGKLRAEKEMSEKQEVSRKGKGVLITAIIFSVIVLFGIGSVFFTELSKPQINPFDYIQVSFQGTDGEGEVVLERINVSEEVDINRVNFDISKERQLLQGETITIQASGGEYRLTETAKSYPVEGLDEYLKDLEKLPADAIEVIHTRAESALKLNLDSSKDAGMFVDMKPVKLFLSTDGKQQNRLYDVFEAHFSTNDGEKILYVVAYFDDVIARNTDPVSVGISGGMYMGHITQVQGWLHIMAYDSVEELRAEILSSQEAHMELKELDF